MDAIEVIKAVAPYVTAVIAVLAAAFTAWLGHRNWIKQFKIQRSDALLKERIRLLTEVPKTLNDAMGLAVNTLYSLAASDAFARVQSATAANGMMKHFTENQEKLFEVLRELEIPEIAVRVYFGDVAAGKIASYRDLLLKTSASHAHIGQASSSIEQVLKATDLDSVDMHELMAKLVPLVMPHIANAFTPAKEARLEAIRAMATSVAANDA